MNTQTNTFGNQDNTNTTNSNSLSVDFQYKTQRGIQLVQRPTTSISTKVGSNQEHKMSDSIIQEKAWTIDDIMQRAKYVNTVPVPTSATSHTILEKLRIPEDLIDANAASQAPFENFIYWSGDVHIHLQMTASPTVQGCVAVVFVPLTSETAIESTIIPNFSALSVNQVCYLFPNTNTAADMVIKYNSPYNNLNIKDGGTASQETTLGYLYYVVLNPMELSTGASDNISISTFTHFEQNKFKVPRHTGVTRRITHHPKAQSEPVGTPQPESKGIVEKVLDKVMPENVIGDIIDGVAGLIGLDNPTVSTVQEPVKVVSTQYLNFQKGAEFIDTMTLDPSGVTTITADTFATTADEMDMSYLYSKYSYLGSFRVNTEDPIGQVVASFPMNPCPNRLQNGSTRQVPLLQYLSTPFEFWTGGIQYRFVVVSTMMQTCKLVVGLNYGEFRPDTLNLIETVASQYGQVIEINQGSNVIDMTVDYIAGTPMLHVPSSNIPNKFDSMGMVNVAVLNPLVATNGAPSNITINAFIAGASDFHLTTLTMSKSLQPQCPVKLSALKKKKKLYVVEESESEDIEVIEIPEPRRSARPSIVRAQSSAQPIITPRSEVDMTGEPNLVSKNDVAVPRSPISQPYVRSVRDILRKYQSYGAIELPNVTNVPPNEGQSNVFEFDIRSLFGRSSIDALLPPTQAYNIPLGNFTLYQLMYRLFKGSLNFKIISRVFTGALDASNFAIYYQPPVARQAVSMADTLRNQVNMFSFPTTNGLTLNSRKGNFQLASSTRLPVHFVNGVNKTAEFKIPYSSRFLSILSTLGANSENELLSNEITDLGRFYIVYNFHDNTVFESDGPYVMDMFFSLSDDARFGTLYNVPTLTTYSYVTSTGQLTTSAAPDDYGTGAPVANTLIIL